MPNVQGARAFAGLALPVIVGSAAVAASASGAFAHEESGSGTLKVESVKVVTANTVDTTFSNPLDPAKLTLSMFSAPHGDWEIPHSHHAASITLSNGNRTVRVVLDRNLHSENPPCEGIEPKCSDDELDWVIAGATDMYGQKIYNDNWRVWNLGSKD